jgi:hypothetical protein
VPFRAHCGYQKKGLCLPFDSNSEGNFSHEKAVQACVSDNPNRECSTDHAGTQQNYSYKTKVLAAVIGDENHHQ